MSENKKYFGSCIWFDNKLGMGFLAWDGDGQNTNDMFVHFSDLQNQPGFKTLKKDQKVEFEIGKNNRGEPKAINVIILEN